MITKINAQNPVCFNHVKINYLSKFSLKSWHLNSVPFFTLIPAGFGGGVDVLSSLILGFTSKSFRTSSIFANFVGILSADVMAVQG